ncbi:MAG: ABC transporter permease, partial [Clostridiales bacterium]|nr:ABC transporter permease [Clostridiales bacterium]
MKKKGIIANIQINFDYIVYYSRIMLKQRVAGNYLGFLWLFIQPLMFMLIYSLVVTVIFSNTMKHFNLHVLIGLNTWTLVQRTIMTSATSITRNKAIFEQVYFHKFVYPTVNMMSYVYEFLISISLVFIMMVFSGVPFTWHLIEIIPILFVCMLFSLGCGLVIAHIGVYLFDLANILEFVLNFVFYLSPIMWSYEFIDFRLMW